MNNDYYVTGTDFEILNCPCYIQAAKGCLKYVKPCKDIKKCLIKSHLVQLSALIGVCQPGTAQMVGSKACFNSFLINKNNE